MERPGFVFGQLLFFALVIVGIIWLVVHLARRSGGGANTTQARWQHAV